MMKAFKTKLHFLAMDRGQTKLQSTLKVILKYKWLVFHWPVDETLFSTQLNERGTHLPNTTQFTFIMQAYQLKKIIVSVIRITHWNFKNTCIYRVRWKFKNAYRVNWFRLIIKSKIKKSLLTRQLQLKHMLYRPYCYLFQTG